MQHMDFLLLSTELLYLFLVFRSNLVGPESLQERVYVVLDLGRLDLEVRLSRMVMMMMMKIKIKIKMMMMLMMLNPGS